MKKVKKENQLTLFSETLAEIMYEKAKQFANRKTTRTQIPGMVRRGALDKKSSP